MRVLKVIEHEAKGANRLAADCHKECSVTVQLDEAIRINGVVVVYVNKDRLAFV